MKTCLPIVLYDSKNYYNIIEFTAILLNGERITLMSWDEIDAHHPYHHTTFKEVEEMIIHWLKVNNLKPRKRYDFGMTFYDIVWVDISNPIEIKYRYLIN